MPSVLLPLRHLKFETTTTARKIPNSMKSNIYVPMEYAY